MTAHTPGNYCFAGWLGTGDPVISHVDCYDHPDGTITSLLTDGIIGAARMPDEHFDAMLRWSKWRRRLRHRGMLVPMFMTPWLEKTEETK